MIRRRRRRKRIETEEEEENEAEDKDDYEKEEEEEGGGAEGVEGGEGRNEGDLADDAEIIDVVALGLEELNDDFLSRRDFHNILNKHQNHKYHYYQKIEEQQR